MQVLPYAGTIWLHLSLLSLHLLHEKLMIMFFTDFQVLETLIAGEGGELTEHHVSQLLCFLWYLQFAQCCHQHRMEKELTELPHLLASKCSQGQQDTAPIDVSYSIHRKSHCSVNVKLMVLHFTYSQCVAHFSYLNNLCFFNLSIITKYLAFCITSHNQLSQTSSDI